MIAHTIKHYEIPGADSDLATIFETVEAKKGELGIVDFSVSQTSLEEVFLTIVAATAGDKAAPPTMGGLTSKTV